MDHRITCSVMGWCQSYLVGYIHTVIGSQPGHQTWLENLRSSMIFPAAASIDRRFSHQNISILLTSENPMNQKLPKTDDFPLIPWTSEKIISASSILHWCRNTMTVSCGSWSRPEVLHDLGRQFNLKHGGFNQSWITNGELIWIIVKPRKPTRSEVRLGYSR